MLDVPKRVAEQTSVRPIGCARAQVRAEPISRKGFEVGRGKRVSRIGHTRWRGAGVRHCHRRSDRVDGGMARLHFLLPSLLLAACSADPEPPAATTAAPLDRPLDGALADPVATRTAALIEAALAQVRSAELVQCITEFQQSGAGRLQPPASGGWLIVASALPADGDAFARRNSAAPELNPEPDDGWQDRIVYRALLRSPDPADSFVACLSCVFDYEGAQIAYRHAYALDTCRRAVPPERDLATVVPLG
jgi:hypothetical protein